MTTCKPDSAQNWILDSQAFTDRMQKTEDSDTSPEKPDIEDIDRSCMQNLSLGDQSAFSGIVERWQERLINFFYHSTHNQADAEDLAQETFLDLYRTAKNYRATGSFRAFIFTLARRRLIDRYRKQTRRPLEFVDPTDSFMQQQCEPDNALREIEEAFYHALAALPENQRSAILLLQQQGLSYDEIAEALNANAGLVKTWIHRARTHLRQKLKGFV